MAAEVYGAEQNEAIIEDGFTAAIALAPNEFATGQVERTDVGATSNMGVRIESSTDSARVGGPGNSPWTDLPVKFNIVLNADKVIPFFMSHVPEFRVGVFQDVGSDAIAATVYWRIGKLYPDAA